MQRKKPLTQYREQILEAAKDGLWRSVEELREAAGIATGANLSRYLHEMKMDLVIEKSEFRLRLMKEHSSAGKLLWRLAKKDNSNNYKLE